MRLYSVADIHGAQYRLNLVLNRIDEYSPDLVVVCGDITQFGPSEVATNFLNQIPVDTIAVRGNCDPFDVNQGIDKSKAENLSLKKYEKDGVVFIGWEPLGKVESPIMDDKTKMFLEKSLDVDSVLVSHVPPFGIQDKVFLGKNIGNKDLLEVVENKRPRLVLCGHTHENPGYIKFKNSIVVNCSIGKRTEGAIIDLSEGINVKIIE